MSFRSVRSRESAESARQVDEFLRRKKEAALNKARGQGDWAVVGVGVAGAVGGAARPVSARPGPSPAYKPPSGRPVSAREAERQEQRQDVRQKFVSTFFVYEITLRESRAIFACGTKQLLV